MTSSNVRNSTCNFSSDTVSLIFFSYVLIFLKILSDFPIYYYEAFENSYNSAKVFDIIDTA
ncbi:MAG: hypothetical protein A3K22_02425 [Deltaproteobacteria bacterium RBG_16_42_7]|nr:MAG: hypothetical protein A3K22_02425 [Deltaproteobacteria bacterium RBG_16_42_7]